MSSYHLSSAALINDTISCARPPVAVITNQVTQTETFQPLTASRISQTQRGKKKKTVKCLAAKESSRVRAPDGPHQQRRRFPPRWSAFQTQRPEGSILQDTDLHFLRTLMKQQPSCPPPLTAPVILNCALTTVCVRVCQGI